MKPPAGPWLLACGLCLLVSAHPATQSARTPASASAASGPAGFDLTRLARLDLVINAAIADHQLPGAVVLIGRGDAVVWRKAYGQRAVAPAAEPMTADTIFDLASLTKVVATTTSIMALVEDGRVRLGDTAAHFIPEFGAKGKERITIRDLLTHMSGLRPDLDLATAWSGAATAIRLACDETPVSPPGRKFTYSDINFIVLGEIVKRVSGQTIDAFSRDHVFAPLGMRDTTFNPDASWSSRIAPTERCPPADASCHGMFLRGVVHDPTSRRMGGVAGHAGLFSTASDLSVFCRMLLGGGAVGSARILSPLTISRMTAPATPVGEPNVRGLGWDLDSSYSSNRGDLLPLGSFGHTGFTGTSLWLDPGSGVYIVFLSNRVHPDGKGDVTPLRSKVATIVASSLIGLSADSTRSMTWPRSGAAASGSSTTAALRAPMQAGIDVLRAGGFAPLRGLRVGLLTNQTGRALDGTATIDLLASAPGVRLTALFSPEHGIRGALDAAVPSEKDAKTGLDVFSLYGQTERPTEQMLAGLDAIVVDLQDVGARFYTFQTTVSYVMQAASERRIKVFVLDRPNPIGGAEIEGPPLDPSAVGFTGSLAPMPIRHGLTMGEIARVMNSEQHIGADLTVVAMKNWTRDEWFDETGAAWVNPSPNMRTLYAATLYPGLGAFEGTNISVGRGTDTPFEQVGAPWIDGSRLADALNSRQLPGLRFYPVRFTPSASVYSRTECQGVFIVVTDRAMVRPVRLGVEVASALTKLFPGKYQVDEAARLFGSLSGIAAIKSGQDPAAIAASWTSGENLWRQTVARFLLY